MTQQLPANVWTGKGKEEVVKFGWLSQQIDTFNC